MLGRPLKLKEGDLIKPRYKNTGDIQGTVTTVGRFMVMVRWQDGKEMWEEPQHLSRYMEKVSHIIQKEGRGYVQEKG